MNSIAFNEAYSQYFGLFGHLKYNFESEGNQKIVLHKDRETPKR